MHGNKLRLFMVQDIAVVGFFNVFSYEAMYGRDKNLPDDERMRHVLRHSRG